MLRLSILAIVQDMCRKAPCTPYSLLSPCQQRVETDDDRSQRPCGHDCHHPTVDLTNLRRLHCQACRFLASVSLG